MTTIRPQVALDTRACATDSENAGRLAAFVARSAAQITWLLADRGSARRPATSSFAAAQADDLGEVDGMVVAPDVDPAAEIDERSVPVVRGDRLLDPESRRAFLIAVFTRARFRSLVERSPSRAALMRFHADHKLLFMAHSPDGQHALGRLVSDGAPIDTYIAEAMSVLRAGETRGKHVNVLQHMVGYLPESPTEQDRERAHAAIAAYRSGRAELRVPLSLIERLTKERRSSEWLATQTYFEPYPASLDVTRRKPPGDLTARDS